MNAFHTPSSTAPLEIPPGMSARDVLKMLRERGVIADERLTMAYLVLSGNRKALRAGEYLFDRPVTTREVIDTLVTGNHLPPPVHRARGTDRFRSGVEVGRAGFGKAEEFVDCRKRVRGSRAGLRGRHARGFPGRVISSRKPTSLRFVRRRAGPLKPWLGVSASVLAQLETRIPSETWPLNLRDTMVLASSG